MGDWAHRFGASPLMRMTASWSWSAWTDRIQVRGAMLRPWAGSPQIVVADPTRCVLSWRSDRTRWRQETGEEAIDRKSPIQVVRPLLATLVRSRFHYVGIWDTMPDSCQDRGVVEL